MANEPWSLTYLGRSTPAPATPDEAVLDRVPNAHTATPYAVRFSAPEFTVPSESVSPRSSIRSIYASAATGISEAEFQAMFSGKQVACGRHGSRTKA